MKKRCGGLYFGKEFSFCRNVKSEYVLEIENVNLLMLINNKVKYFNIENENNFRKYL